MQWQSLGFTADPLSTEAIALDTLPLYTGHANEIDLCLQVLHSGNRRLVIEGSRGVGTTSFSNYLRFTLQKEKLYFTPRNEIRVDAGWQLETLLSVVIANIVREIELFSSEALMRDERFQNAKSLSRRISETYRSFGVEAFGVGFNYGKSAGPVTQPILTPSAVLGHHLEDLVALIRATGYKNGLLLQLNNLDVGAIHDTDHLRYLFNALRDYAQTDGISWLLVGDNGLRRFIAQEVDRLDDIISFETSIGPLSKDEFNQLILNRINFYRTSDKVQLPIDMDVFLYLFDMTKGRLRYIFGLIARLMASLHIGDLTDRVTLDIGRPMLIKLARVRVERNDLTNKEIELLRLVVSTYPCTVTEAAKQMSKSMQYIGKVLNKLCESKLLLMQKQGKKKYYSPSLDAIIAYSETNFP